MTVFTLEIDLPTQEMRVFQDGKCVKKYLVSTAKNGAGEEYGSMQTPRGWHVIRAKIGSNCPVNTVFVKRRPTGEVYTPNMMEEFPDRDWILTRIFWLSGMEVSKNRFKNAASKTVDSMKRKIYIHGSPDSVTMGTIGSRGCVRMRNNDILELFDQIPVGTRVLIKE